MWFCTGLASAKLTLLSWLGATRGAPQRQCLFLSDLHGYIMQVYLGTRCSIVTSATDAAQSAMSLMIRRMPSECRERLTIVGHKPSIADEQATSSYFSGS